MVMIKSILHAISSYVMKNFFWWGHGGANNRGISWLSWKKLLMHKVHAGVGFIDLPAFNLAMLAKQGWKFQTNPESLVTCLFKARYFLTRSSSQPDWEITRAMFGTIFSKPV